MYVTFQALRSQLEEESSQHQRTLSEAQQLHSQKLTQIKRRHRDDVRKYDDQIAELQELLDIGKQWIMCCYFFSIIILIIVNFSDSILDPHRNLLLNQTQHKVFFHPSIQVTQMCCWQSG